MVSKTAPYKWPRESYNSEIFNWHHPQSSPECCQRKRYNPASFHAQLESLHGHGGSFSCNTYYLDEICILRVQTTLGKILFYINNARKPSSQQASLPRPDLKQFRKALHKFQQAPGKKISWGEFWGNEVGRDPQRSRGNLYTHPPGTFRLIYALLQPINADLFLLYQRLEKCIPGQARAGASS